MDEDRAVVLAGSLIVLPTGMEELLATVSFVAAVIAAALFWAVRGLRNRVAQQEERLAALTRRVFDLENTDQSASDLAEPVAVVAPPPLPVALTEPELAREPEAEPAGEEDWEAVIGGNWLNRVGALVLVIGIALFLGYSLTMLGPAGKVGIGFAVSAAMLGAGVALRTSERYGSFSLSLVGGGWAAIYFTAYAAHALEPARIIDNPLLAGLLLFGVSAGMIVHALAYGSEQGTALAFLFSFITLNISPLTGFSIYAALLLALSMLGLAYVRSWFRLAVAGVLLAYATFILRRDAGEPLAQWALWVQWLAFEAFDILDLYRRGLSRGLERSVFLLNAAGFIGASLLYGWENIGWFLFFSALAYLVSAVLRGRLLPHEDRATGRLLGGGYEGAFTASAALMAGALVERFNGINITLALMVQGEMVVLAGYALGNSFIRGLGGALLGLAFFRIISIDQFGVEKRVWTPTAGLMAVVFAANRWRGGWAYAAGAGILAGMVVNAEAPREWAPFLLAMLGVGALVLAVRRDLEDIRLQHMIWALGVFVMAWIALDYGPAASIPVALTVATFYACEFLARGHRYTPPLYSVLGTTLLTLLLFEEVQGRLLTVALGVEGTALLVAGMFASERVLRISGLVLFLGCIGKAFVYDLRQLDTFSRILSFIVLGLLLLGASWIYTRFRERIRRLL